MDELIVEIDGNPRQHPQKLLRAGSIFDQ